MDVENNRFDSPLDARFVFVGESGLEQRPVVVFAVLGWTQFDLGRRAVLVCRTVAVGTAGTARMAVAGGIDQRRGAESVRRGRQLATIVHRAGERRGRDVAAPESRFQVGARAAAERLAVRLVAAVGVGVAAAAGRRIQGESQLLGRVEIEQRVKVVGAPLGRAHRTLGIEGAFGGGAVAAAVGVGRRFADQPVSDHIAFTFDLDLAPLLQHVAAQAIEQLLAGQRAVDLQSYQLKRRKKNEFGSVSLRFWLFCRLVFYFVLLKIVKFILEASESYAVPSIPCAKRC